MHCDLRRAWLLVFGLLTCGFHLACGGGQPDARGDGPLQVVATTTIVADLVRAVGGADVEVISLMGAGVDPHLYKPSAGDVRRLSSASVVFYSGLHLEGKMSEVLEEVGQRGVTTAAVSACIEEDRLITNEGSSGLHDPHVWFDVSLWIEAARCAGAVLQGVDLEHAASYQERTAAYVAELEALEEWVEQRVAVLPSERRVLVTAHDAFGYFGVAYGFDVRGLLGVSTAAEAGTADVKELAELIVARAIPAIFVETSVSPKYIQALQEAVQARGAEVVIGGSLFSDALGDPASDAATYVGTVKANVETIVSALAGGGEGDH